MIVYDSETWPVHPSLKAPRMVCGQFSETVSGEQWVLPREQALDALACDLANSDRILGHNIAFDSVVAAANRPQLTPAIFKAYRQGRVLDTYLRQRLIDLARGHLGYHPLTNKKLTYSLAECLERLCNIDISATKGADSWRTRYCELDGVPIDQWPFDAYSYARNDVCYPAMVYNAQSADVGREQLPNEQAQARNAFALALISAWGVHVNQGRVREARARFEAQIGNINEQLIASGLMRADGRKIMARIREAVARCYANPKLTDTGKVATSREVLANSGDPLLLALAETDKPKGFLKKYIKRFEAVGEFALCASYWPLQATGRASASKPPIQQVPRDGGLRECFEPRDGFDYAIVDYSQIEMATLAQVQLVRLGKSTIAEHLTAGRDLHLVLAGNLLGMTYEHACKLYADNDEAVANARQFAKVGNYGFAGGMGAETFVDYAKGYDLDISTEQAVELREVWFGTFPCMRDYFKYINSLFEVGVDRCAVEQVFSGRVRGGCLFTEACNTGFQGLAADGALDAAFCVAEESLTVPASPLYGSHTAIFMHDELVVEVPTNRGHEAATRLAQVMVERMQAWVPNVPVAAEPVLSRVWSKKAKPVRDGGRLVPWEG